MTTAVVPVTVAVEGLTDVPVARRLLSFAGCAMHIVHGRAGKHHIDRHIRGYNNAAKFVPWLVLRDLDHDGACAAGLVALLLPERAKWMRLRIAVRATESWLLADAERIGRFMKIKSSLVPSAPDELDDPKTVLVDLARGSPIAALRADMVPAPGMSGRVGPGYSGRMSEFALYHWRPDVAAGRSPSLGRCIERVRELSTYRP